MKFLKQIFVVMMCGLCIFNGNAKDDDSDGLSALWLLGLADALSDDSSDGKKKEVYDYKYLPDKNLYHFYYYNDNSYYLESSIGSPIGEFAFYSGDATGAETVRILFSDGGSNNAFNNYCRSIGSSKLRRSVTLSWGAGKAHTFRNSSLSADYSDNQWLLTIDIYLANGDFSSDRNTNISKAMDMFSSTSISYIAWDSIKLTEDDTDALYYNLEDTFFKAAFADMKSRTGRKYTSGNSSYTGSANSSYSGKVPSYGSVSYMPLATSSPFGSIKKAIDGWGQCRTGAVSDGGDGVAVYGTNGYWYSGNCHEDLKAVIKKANNGKYRIADIAISKDGSYAFIYGTNGYSCRGVPSSMANKIKEYNSDNEDIISVAFNDSGSWAVISTKIYSADSSTMETLNAAKAKYGYVNSVSMSANGLIICCANGIYYKNAPKNVIDKLKTLDYIPKVIKFTDNGLYFITDGDTRYTYFL